MMLPAPGWKWEHSAALFNDGGRVQSGSVQAAVSGCVLFACT